MDDLTRDECLLGCRCGQICAVDSVDMSWCLHQYEAPRAPENHRVRSLFLDGHVDPLSFLERSGHLNSIPISDRVWRTDTIYSWDFFRRPHLSGGELLSFLPGFSTYTFQMYGKNSMPARTLSPRHAWHLQTVSKLSRSSDRSQRPSSLCWMLNARDDEETVLLVRRWMLGT